MPANKRKADRRNVAYYLAVTEPGTNKFLGVVLDISSKGFKLDGQAKTPDGTVRRFYINLPDDIASQSARTFTARSKWCRPDKIDPSSYVVGYEFINISPENAAFFQQIFEAYGAQKSAGRDRGSDDYIWK